MKIIHISDLHISANGFTDTLERIYQLFRHILQSGFDHLVITGDITENGTEQEFEIFREFLKLFQLLDPRRVTVVIGNHDIYGGLEKAEDVLTLPEKWARTDYDEKVRLFHSYIPELDDQTIRVGMNQYPFVKKLEGASVLALNTIDQYSVLQNPLASNGKIDAGQLERLELLTDELDVTRPVIIAVHHHFNKITAGSNFFLHNMWMHIEKQTMKLRKKKQVLKLFSRLPVAAVLHGHYHTCEAYERGGLLFLNSGSSIKSVDGHMHYNILKVSRNAVTHVQKTLAYMSRKRHLHFFETLHLNPSDNSYPGQYVSA